MPHTEFAERQFETCLIRELIAPSCPSLFFQPSQSMEKTLGYDVALYTHYFYHLCRGGVSLRSQTHTPTSLRHSARVPPIIATAFLQFKRPFYAERWWQGSFGGCWRRSYYDMRLDAHQVSALYSLAQRTAGLATVRVAAPAFRRFSDLFCHSRSGTITRHTRFVDPAALVGSPPHTHYTYVDAIGPGMAHSEPREVHPIGGVHQAFEALLRVRESEAKPTDAYSFFEQLWSRVREAVPDSRVECIGMIEQSTEHAAQYLIRQIRETGVEVESSEYMHDLLWLMMNVEETLEMVWGARSLLLWRGTSEQGVEQG